MIKSTIAVSLFTLTLSSVASASAPIGWQGLYKGQCSVNTPRGEVLYSFPMSLNIKEKTAKAADWIVIYGEGQSKSVRNYSLLTISEEFGHYAVDENNGVVIDQFLVGNEFISLFEVGGTKLNSKYVLNTNGTMDVLIDTYTFKPIRDNQVGQFTVSSYGLRTQQKCRLYKWW
ncbi:hypothetical protein ACSLBF_03715 [Pseudoalteromonas sp. T1lg65]|uniref:hypothetical protein n=1 Tax=Pseudoalteromonas sp. T1lg65 TaxID=2077101 RepID=UPI003F79D365